MVVACLIHALLCKHPASYATPHIKSATRLLVMTQAVQESDAENEKPPAAGPRVAPRRGAAVAASKQYVDLLSDEVCVLAYDA
jgi:hypothetical protein